MTQLEKTILDSFKKYMGKEIEGLDLMVAFSEDLWPDEMDGVYRVDVMETKDNGKVWTCECTKNGKVKDTYQI